MRARRTGPASVVERTRGAQPRPALGLRPWFALERRARSFLRFAFAMGGRLPARDRYASAVVRLPTGATLPLVVADRPLRRLLGLAPRAEGRAWLAAADAVHGRSMAEPLDVAFLDGTGRVLAVRRLEPGAVVSARGACFALELPAGRVELAPGDRLAVAGRRAPILDPCPAPSSSAARRSATSAT
ncbi:MAG TPA: DUF192 domain-containing protein [Actinobacteria bacterium]|nr:DUF192 domain-containing protein [Actinomycetota bacterium]